MMKALNHEGKPNTNVFITNGIVDAGAKNKNNCTIDVEQTAWLDLAGRTCQNLLAPGAAEIVRSLRSSSPYLRSFCREPNWKLPAFTQYLSSWQDGRPHCGSPVPSSTLTSITATVLLGSSVFRDIPTPLTKSPGTNSPNSNNNGNNDDGNDAAQNLEQGIIGICIGAALLLGIFCTVRYLKKQAHHRNARLEGGMIKGDGDRPPSDLGYGTYSQVTSNTFM